MPTAIDRRERYQLGCKLRIVFRTLAQIVSQRTHGTSVSWRQAVACLAATLLLLPLEVGDSKTNHHAVLGLM